MTDNRITAVQYGVGPIGARIVEAAVERNIEVVGAIDIDPEKVGRPLGAVATLEHDLDVEITDNPSDALAAAPDLVFHSTASAIDEVTSQLTTALEAGANVVSTTEELAYPWRDNADIAAEIDRVATRADRTVLGTGINPGFAMDFLPAVLTIPCRRVDQIRVTRVQDAAERRQPLQRKIGAGTALETFEREIATEAGHVGLPESVAMLAAALDWDLDRINETIEPVVSDSRIESDHVVVKSGEVAGIRQTGTGVVDSEERIELTLEMYLGASDPRDVVEIDGVPSLTIRTDGGFHGDVTTPAIVVNSSRNVVAADPGLRTMIELPPGSWRETITEA